MSIHKLLGQRCLINEKGTYHTFNVLEVKIIEISPSGNWVKLLNMYGKKYWKTISDISVIEVLKDLKSGKPKD
ncbi:MAG: hypothetical protein KDD03_02615 [Gelidibacter sp.]|nr:hypothetical protein [Gelidibacter sp.]